MVEICFELKALASLKMGSNITYAGQGLLIV